MIHVLILSDTDWIFLKTSSVFLVALLFLPVAVFAADLLVPGEYRSIQEAVDIAVDHDRIIVEEGLYSGQGFRGISFLGKKLTVQGAGPELTIIDCEQQDRAFDFQYGENTDSVIRDLAVINGLDGCGT